MRRICVAVILAVLAVTGAKAQIFCWNLENYFDAKDSPDTADEAFTPGGEHHWTRRKAEAKRNLIAKTIIASAECFDGEMPVIAGLCEVENAEVLRSLAEDTPLAKIGYKTIHRESPDPRGIDVALLYDPARAVLLDYGWITVSGLATREILYAKVAMPDTLHVFVNHWPSKYSGARSSEARRLAVSAALEAKLDSIAAAERAPAIVIMGDFNDTPSSPAVAGLCERRGLVNLTANVEGTIRFKGKWELIDLMLATPSAAALIGPAEAFKPDFLLEEDKSFLGRKPRRTNIGPRYNGGASDHLPIVANVLSWHPHP
ncbi:MAG: endonuclease [Bacteroidales bacterium]|nr:endonuclease [Bacteroidales bacterium]